MSRVSVDLSQPRPLFGGKSCRGHGNNMDKKNTILIDVDSDNYDNVIIIDVPDSESFPNKLRGPSVCGKGKSQMFTNVINIDDDDDDDDDDDEDDDEAHDDKQSDDGVKKSSSRAEASTSRNFSRAGDGATDERQHVQENVSPVRLSKCKCTYSGKGFATNHYGLDTDSETEGDASDTDDFSDCELMVDSSGRVQKQWEKAFFKRRKYTNKCDSCVGKNCSTSKGIDENQDQQNGTEGETRRTKKGPFSSNTNKLETSNGYKASSSGMNVDTEADACPLSDLRDKDYPFVHTKLNEQKDNEPESSKKNTDPVQKNTASLNPSHQEQSEAEEVRCTDTVFTGTTTSAFKTSTTPGLKTASTDLKATTAPAFTSTTSTATATPSFTATTATPASTSTATHRSMATMRKCQKPAESVAGSVSSSLNDDSLKNFRKGTTRFNNEKNSFNKPGVYEIPSPDNIPLNEADLRQDDKLKSSEKVGGKDKSCQNEDESRVISEREKLKETDEYKKAMDEEWASRQKVLQIQAEEAQRQKQLRKRKKAESQRLSDMKRRQNKRLEEMRTSQKKDEENMNLKEKIRAEVRKDLQKIELSCKNMASLLHRLGVSVTGWPNPLPQEVQTAYKKSLLTFHPDRASRSDIRQQVEAEEKFKLVNRLKEKFSPSL